MTDCFSCFIYQLILETEKSEPRGASIVSQQVESLVVMLASRIRAPQLLCVCSRFLLMLSARQQVVVQVFRVEFLAAPVLAWPIPGYCSHSGRKICLCPPAFQIN